MAIDPDIRDQAYHFFIQEAPVLLHKIEAGLLTLRSDRSTAKIHELMRAAHSIKGGSASVGLDAIATLAHRLENIFKALYSEELEIDTELESQLLCAYDYLRLPLIDQVTTGDFDAEEALSLAEPIFSQLEEQLGNALAQVDNFIPSSSALGVNIALSIFEVDVAEGLERLAAVIKNPQDYEVAGELRAQAEVFNGFAMLLDMPGFGAIAQTALAALNAHPDQALAITQLALADFQAGREAVLREDDTKGGTPSDTLLALAAGDTRLGTDDTGSSPESLSNSGVSASSQSPIPNPNSKIEASSISIPGESSIDNLDASLPLLEEIFGSFADTQGDLDNRLAVADIAQNIGEPSNPTSDRKQELEERLTASTQELISDTANSCNTNSDVSDSLDVIDVEWVAQVQSVSDAFAQEPLSLQEVFGSAVDTSEIQAPDSNALVHLEAGIFPTSPSISNAPQAQAEDIGETQDVPETLEAAVQSIEQLFESLPSIEDTPDTVSDSSVNIPINQAREKKRKTNTNRTTTPKLTLRVDVDRLERMNNVVGELTINRNTLSLQNEQLQSSVQELLKRFPRFQKMVAQLQELSNQMLVGASVGTQGLQKTKGVGFQGLKVGKSLVPLDTVQVESLEKNKNLQPSTFKPSTLQTFNHSTSKPSTLQPNTARLVKFNTEDPPKSPLKRGTYIPPFLRGARGDRSYPSSIALQPSTLPLRGTLREQPSTFNHPTFNISTPQPTIDKSHFDTLEMDSYGVLHSRLQGILEEMAEIEEAVDDIALFARATNQTLEQQRQMHFQLRDELMWARMLPLGEVLNRFPRLLRDLSTTYHKPVSLKLNGTGVLVDRAILEKLYDPLVHLLRNSFDHGIEPPEIRHQVGKPEQGNIEISAYHKGSQTIIEVKDDGGGVQPALIRSRALERGLLSAEQLSKLNDGEVIQLIFEPGFSTASQVTELSGRGVGLDVLREQLRSLKGTVTVTSFPGVGTTFTIRLPLTLTIAKLLICTVDSSTLALPSESIEEIVIPKPGQAKQSGKQRFLHWREQLIPVYRVTDLLDYTRPLPQIPLSKALDAVPSPDDWALPMLVLKQGQQFFALEIERLLTEQELVIKPFGAAIAPPSYTYGCTILGDGSLIPVIDGVELLDYCLGEGTGDWKQKSESSSPPNLIASAPITPELPCLEPSPPQLRTASGYAIPQTPVTSSPSPPLSPPNEQQSQTPSQGTSNKAKSVLATILVVDDAITLRRTLALSLEKAGFRVLQARDGQEAIAKLQENPSTQLVICDIEMPNMNGFDFLSYRRQDPQLSAIPVMMLTSRSNNKHRWLAMHLGATAYFTKPYIEQTFLKAIKDIIGSH